MIDKRRHRNERIAAAIVVLIAAALTVWALKYERRERKAVQSDARYIPRPEVITPEIELLRDYLRIDTTTREGVAAGARWLVAEFQKRGVPAQLVESAPGFFNVYARIKGRERGGALLLLNHIDVVPPGGDWSHPPFGADIRFNELYGRGALDMKSVALCQLLAFASLARSGRPPAHDLVFLATADEETGSANGLRWLLEHRPELFESVGYAVTEGGLAEVMTEQMTYFGIEIGGKQVVEVRLEADAREPLRQARFELQRYIISRRKPDRVLPGIRDYFRDLAPARIKYQPYLADIDGTIAAGQFWQLPETYREFTQDTMRVTSPRIENGRWVMTASLLDLPDVDPDQRIAWLQGVVARYGVTVVTLDKAGPVPLSPRDTALFRILADQAGRQYHARAGVQVLYRSATECRFLRPRGVVCYGLSPFPVNFFQSESIHHLDERIRLDWFRQGVTYVDRVVARWAGPGQ